MDLEILLERAKERELEISLEYERRKDEYKAKVLQNNEIRRQLKKEEDALLSLIPQEPHMEGSEWGKELETIRSLERLLELERGE